MDNTRPVHTNTADRAPHTPMTHGYVRALVGTVCFEWNIQTNTVHPSEQRVETTSHGAGGNLKNEQITSCLASDGPEFIIYNYIYLQELPLLFFSHTHALCI